MKKFTRAQQKRLDRHQHKIDLKISKKLRIVCAFYIHYHNELYAIKLDCYKTREQAWKAIQRRFKGCEFVAYMFITWNKSKNYNYTLKSFSERVKPL